MKISVTQVDNDYASNSVSVYVYGEQLGCIGPGGTVSTQVPDTDRCEVRVVCGSYSKTLYLGQDSNLVVSWTLHPPAMAVTNQRR